MFISRCDPEDRYVHLNQAWLDFARQNWRADFAPESILGDTWRRHISDRATLHLYDRLVQRARQLARPLSVAFRCDSPDLRRFMEISALPLPDGGLEWASRLLRQEPRPLVRLPEPDAELVARLAIMCSWCKKVQVPEWAGVAPLVVGDWVEVEEIMPLFSDAHAGFYPELSHGVCPACFRMVLDKL